MIKAEFFHDQLEAVFSNMVEAVIVVDRNKQVVNLNRAAINLLQVDLHASLGKSFSEVIVNKDLQRFILKIFQSKSILEEELTIKKNRKKTIYLHGNGVFINSGSNEEGSSAIIVLNDITKMKHLENIRSDFVANVSHELKTPIATIKGFVETMVDGSLDDKSETRHFLGIVLNNANRLKDIVEDILTLSRIEEDESKSAITLQEESLFKAIAASMRSCSSKASTKGIELVLDYPKEIKALINAPLLEQAITNLIVNAIKYSDQGKAIVIRAKISDNENLLIQVVDQGIGIEPIHLPRLFERFYRCDKARSRKLGGTGLGLAIVKHIAVSHNGNVRVESSVGKGSIFTIELPGLGKSAAQSLHWYSSKEEG